MALWQGKANVQKKHKKERKERICLCMSNEIYTLASPKKHMVVLIGIECHPSNFKYILIQQ